MHHVVLWNKFRKLEYNFRYVNADESKHYYSFASLELTLWNRYQKIRIIWAQRICQGLEETSQYLRSRYRRRSHDDREIQVVENFERLFIFKEVVWQRKNESIIWAESEKSRYWFDEKYRTVIYVVIQFVLKKANGTPALFERCFKQELN